MRNVGKHIPFMDPIGFGYSPPKKKQKKTETSAWKTSLSFPFEMARRKNVRFWRGAQQLEGSHYTVGQVVFLNSWGGPYAFSFFFTSLVDRCMSNLCRQMYVTEKTNRHFVHRLSVQPCGLIYETTFEFLRKKMVPKAS